MAATTPAPSPCSELGAPSRHQAGRHPSILPPHLLRRLAESADERVAHAAASTLDQDRAVRGRREARAAHTRTGAARAEPGEPMGPATGLVPDEVRRRARAQAPPSPPPRLAPGDRAGQEAGREGRQVVGGERAGEPRVQPRRSLHDASGGTELPGALVRAEGQAPVADASVNEAYDAMGATWQMFLAAFGRDSLDGRGLAMVGSVHYGHEFDNAFWDGEQMVFGDGDGVYFNSFTDSLDVIGHELTHGVTQYTAGLVYLAQAGALNESVSDVFGSLVKQWSRGESAADADWLIGAGLFTDRVAGSALRSLKAPGTAYDDPVLGKDPQPADMDGYQDLPHDDRHDNGGVHINSGIPNRAFYLAATGIGGKAWEGAGLVWYDVLTAGRLAKDADFAAFAAATVEAAEARFADRAKVEAVADAWSAVKVPLPARRGRSR